MTGPTASMAQELEKALTSHDLDGLVALFADDYRCDWPCRPDRSFTGSEQVRTNWEQLFAGIPDVRWALLRQGESPDAESAEWEVTGTSFNGSRVLMNGVAVIGIVDDRIAWSRFYLEPVVHDDLDVAASVARTASGAP